MALIYNKFDVNTDFTAGANGNVNHSNRYDPNSWQGMKALHLGNWFNLMAGCTWDVDNFVGGSGYTDGVYTNQHCRRENLDYGAGWSLELDVTVSGGVVTEIAISNDVLGHPMTGNGFLLNDVVTFDPDRSDVGAGSGFELTCLTGDGDIGWVRDITCSTNTGSRDTEWLIGFSRSGGFSDFRQFMKFSQQNSTTAYINSGTAWQSDTGIGSLLNQTSFTASSWLSSSGYSTYIYYDPEAKYFLWSDSQYKHLHGWSKLEYPDGFTPAVNKNISAQWVGHYQTRNVVNVNSRTSSAEFIKIMGFTTYAPYDPGVIMTKQAIPAGSCITGYLNNKLGTVQSGTGTNGAVLEFGTGTRYRFANQEIIILDA